jgi:hypothetical protein
MSFPLFHHNSAKKPFQNSPMGRIKMLLEGPLIAAKRPPAVGDPARTENADQQ